LYDQREAMVAKLKLDYLTAKADPNHFVASPVNVAELEETPVRELAVATYPCGTPIRKSNGNGHRHGNGHR
jgi:deoxyhypusine synthase